MYFRTVENFEQLSLILQSAGASRHQLDEASIELDASI